MADKKTLQNPFPGLRPFQSDEEHLFFGRETQTLELLQILRDNRFVGVIGTSGSGKSSLVRCGLLSELYGGAFLKAGTDWEVAVMNPGGGPFKQLSKSLVASDIYDSEEADVHLKLNATLRRSRLGLVEAIRQAKLPEGTNFLLVVDQFEEIFRYSEAGEEEGEAADDFISMILEAAKQSNVPIYVIITMRSDYIGDCSKFEGLPEEINEGEYLIPRLSREEYKSVIEGPVRVGGAKLAPRLQQRLLNDIGTESDQLPCLQHALMRTWDAWVERDEGEELDLEDYRAIGGMGKALSIHADEIFDTFTDKGTRETATRMFRAITEKGDDNRGIRRPLRLQQLADITNHSIEEVRSVVDPYRQQGVTFLTPPSSRELDPKTVIDISHESLMRVWGRLRNWVEEEAQSARIYRRLVDTSSLWKKEEAGLYHDPDLQIAQSWRDQYQPNKDWADLYGGGFEVATEFLEASEEEGRKAEREKELARQKELEQAQELAEARERSAKSMKRFAVVVGVVAVIALGAMGFAVNQQKIAETAQNEAVTAQNEAVTAKGAAEKARETLRKEFINSDINLGVSFSEQNQIGRGIAHFARALERDPENSSIVDRSFNLIAYSKPPGYRAPKIELNSNYIETSTASKNGEFVMTSIHTNNEFQNKTPNLMIWEPNSSTPAHSIYAGPGRFQFGNDIDVSPDGQTAALGLNGVTIIDLETGDLKKFQNADKSRSVKFSVDGARILTASGGTGGEAQIIDSKTGSILGSYETKTYQPRWSPDESKLFFGAHRQGKSAVLDLENNDLKVFEHEGNPGMTPFGCFDAMGGRILTISGDQKFNVWNIESGELEFFVEHNRINNGFGGAVGIFTPDNQRLITVAKDLYVRMWSAKDGAPIDSINISSNHAVGQAPVFSNDGLRILIPLQNGQAYVGTFIEGYPALPSFNKTVPLSEAYAFLANNGKVKPLLLPVANVSSAAKLKCEDAILLGTSNGKAGIYDLDSGEPLIEPITHRGVVSSVATSHDGNTFATGSTFGTVKIWDRYNLDDPILEIFSDNPSELNTNHKISFTADGKAVWIINEKQSTKWSLANGKRLHNAKIAPTRKLGISSLDGRYTAIIKGQSIIVYDSENEKNIPLKVKIEGRVDVVSFSKDNRYFVAGTANGKVRAWSTLNGDPIGLAFDLELPSSTENIDSLALNEDFTKLAVGCKSGQLYLVDIDLNRKNQLEVKRPRGEVFRSEIIDTLTETHSVNIDVKIEGAKKLFLIVEDGGNGWYHDKANWIEPKLIGENMEIDLTTLKWVSASTNWGEVQIGTNVAQNPISVDNKIYSSGIGTHGYSVIEYDIPEGMQRFKSIAGLDDQGLAYQDSQSCVRFSVYLDSLPGSDETFSSFVSVKGDAPCSNIRINSAGNLLAASFTDGTTGYIQVWDLDTFQPISNKLEHGKNLSNFDFLLNDFQMVAWSELKEESNDGIASVWDVSIRKDLITNESYSKIFRALGGKELNEESKAVTTKEIDKKLRLIGDLSDDTLIDNFLDWQTKFPSKRGDSPFRSVPTKDYIKILRSQNDLSLLNDAVRLDPTDAVSIAKRGALRLASEEYPKESTRVLAHSDAIKAYLLNPSSIEVIMFASAIHEYLGDIKKAQILFSKIGDVSNLKIESLWSIIQIQESLNLNKENRLKVIDLALSLIENSKYELRKDLIVKRFRIAVDSGDYSATNSDWLIIKEWNDFPSGINKEELVNLYFKSIESESDRLVAEKNYEAAIEILKPAAIASLSDKETDTLSSLVSKLIEIEYRETPPVTIIEKNSSWFYLDDGSFPGDEWFELSAPTEGWSKGLAKLGYGGDGEKTVLNFGDDVQNKHLTYYFKQEFNVDESSKSTFLTANVVRDDGVIVYLNGKEVFRDNMNVTDVTHLTEATGTANPNGDELETFSFPIRAELLTTGKNIIAAEVHQTHGQSSDVGFQLELRGSNQDVSSYIISQLKDPKQKELLEDSISLLPIGDRENADKAFKYNIGLLGLADLETSPVDAGFLAMTIAEKIGSKEIDDLINLQISILQNDPSTENLTRRAEVLDLRLKTLTTSGSPQDEIKKLQKLIITPPRDKTLSPKLVDLSDYYNASMFYNPYFHGKGPMNSLSFIHKYYNQENNIPFDLRGAIRLESGLYNDGKTAGEKFLSGFKLSFPNEVKGIKIEMKANKIHFLMGAAFASWMEKGVKSATFKIYYKDKSFEELPILSLIDIIDWWEPHHEPGKMESLISEDKIGYLGQHQNGSLRGLTKPFWINPFPEKEISHIDFLKGDAKGQPFLVGITIE